MKLLFPCHPLKRRLPDPDYEMEVSAAREVGFECEFYSLELLREGNAVDACAGVHSELEEATTPILHRGWMMSEALYSQLEAELRKRRSSLVVSSEQYAQAHYLPNWYPHMAQFTAESVWMSGKDLDEAWSLYQRLSDGPALVKDYVKSAKHRWNEACFIPASTTQSRFEEIIKAFLQARGSQFNKGIVFRRYCELVTLEQDLRGQPVHEEYRMFFWRGKLIASTPALRAPTPLESLEKWSEIARRVENPFISMDVARQLDGSWLVIEVGDGGVSGLPPAIEPKSFYSELLRLSKLQP